MAKPDGRTTRHRQRTQEEIERQAIAHAAIAKAVWNQGIPNARKYKCHGCDRQAHVMHHCSYHPDDHFCFVPLCGSCHGRVHSGSLVLDYGVVPMTAGLMRIAIATAP